MKVTIKDIAKKANVSKMTVSRVLNGNNNVAPKTVKKIKSIIQDLNYQPNLIARSLSSKRSMNIGVTIRQVDRIFFDEYVAQISSAILDVALKHNYQITFFPIGVKSGGSPDYAKIIGGSTVDGLIVLKSLYQDINLTILAEQKIPFVLVNNRKYSKNFSFVDTKNVEGIEKAVNYLHNKGHRKIAFMDGSINERNSIDRKKGFHKAINNRGLKLKKQWMINGDFDTGKAYDVMGKIIFSKERPTAIICANDYMAIGALDRLKVEGLKVPNDMAVVGFDDIEIASRIDPPLTTLRQPLYELGEIATKLLLSIINGDKVPPLRKILDVELIERESA